MVISQLKDKLNNSETKSSSTQKVEVLKLILCLRQISRNGIVFVFATFINFDCKIFGASVASFVFNCDYNTFSISSSIQFRMPFIDRSVLVLGNLTWRRSSREKRWRGEKGKLKRLRWYFNLFDLPPSTLV